MAFDPKDKDAIANLRALEGSVLREALLASLQVARVRGAALRMAASGTTGLPLPPLLKMLTMKLDVGEEDALATLIARCPGPSAGQALLEMIRQLADAKWEASKRAVALALVRASDTGALQSVGQVVLDAGANRTSDEAARLLRRALYVLRFARVEIPAVADLASKLVSDLPEQDAETAADAARAVSAPEQRLTLARRILDSRNAPYRATAQWAKTALSEDAALDLVRGYLTREDRDTESGQRRLDELTEAFSESPSHDRWVDLLREGLRADSPLHTKQASLRFAARQIALRGRPDDGVLEAALAMCRTPGAEDACTNFFDETSDPQGIPFLLDRLGTPDGEYAALEALRKMPPTSVAPALTSWAIPHTASDRVREFLAELPAKAPELGQAAVAEPEVLQRLIVAGDVDSVARTLDAGAKAAGGIAGRPETHLHVLVYEWLDWWGGSVNSSAALRIAALLVAHGADPKARLGDVWQPAEQTKFPPQTTPLSMVSDLLAKSTSDQIARANRSLPTSDLQQMLTVFGAGIEPTAPSWLDGQTRAMLVAGRVYRVEALTLEAARSVEAFARGIEGRWGTPLVAVPAGDPQTLTGGEADLAVGWLCGAADADDKPTQLPGLQEAGMGESWSDVIRRVGSHLAQLSLTAVARQPDGFWLMAVGPLPVAHLVLGVSTKRPRNEYAGLTFVAPQGQNQETAEKGILGVIVASAEWGKPASVDLGPGGHADRAKRIKGLKGTVQYALVAQFDTSG